MISKKEVQHIAKLARLGLTTAEIKKFQKDLSSILDYIEKLKKVDISKVKPTTHSVEIKNVFREDLVKSNIKNQKPSFHYRAPIYGNEGEEENEVLFALWKRGGRRERSSLRLSKILLELAPETQKGFLKVKSIF